ncbi:MAG: glutaminase [Saprospiraceae bacterium]|jgi:glutaminase
MDYQKIINEIASGIDLSKYEGEVADYIPELGKVSPDKFGIHLNSIDSGHYFHGDSNEKFSIQSISKVFTLTLAALNIGDKILERVDVEPSGDPFNSLTQLEYENGIPRNPLINAGALVICDILLTELENPKEDFLAFVRKIAQNPKIDYNLKVAKSEWKSGFRNAALVNFMKSFGNIHNRTEEVLDLYFHTCSIEMTCKELSETFMLFANRGCILTSGERILTGSQTKRINAVMQTCGFYDEAGEFAFRVGLPGKSGVGGGIAAVHPGYYSVVVWSPKLNPKGNSTLGMRVLELLTTKTELSVF